MLEPTGNLILCQELTENEKGDLGFPPGVGGAADVGVVMTCGPDISLELKPGEKVYFTCQTIKCGAQSLLIHSDCVVAVDRGVC